MNRALTVWNGITFRPIATAWVAGCLLGAAIAQGWINLSAAVTAWTGLTILLLLAANHRETAAINAKVSHVQDLVNSQHDLLEEYVAILKRALLAANVAVPDDPAGKR